MSYLKKIMLILVLLIIPFDVNAGIICNDGWESSCIVSGPGCCSHHGGVAGSSSNYANYNHYYNDGKNKVVDNSENGDYGGILTLIISLLLLPMLIGMAIGIEESKSNSTDDLD